MSEDSQRERELHAVAALLGATTGSLKQMDSDIIEEGTNLKVSSKDWDPKAILKNHIVNTGGIGNPPPPPPTDVGVPTGGGTPPPPVNQPVPLQEGYVQPVQAPLSPDVAEKLELIDKKLDVIISVVSNLESLDEKLGKSVERGLNGKMKQITIKLNDSTDKK